MKIIRRLVCVTFILLLLTGCHHSTGTDSTVANYSASGNEPFWNFQIVGNEAVYSSPEVLSGTTVPITRIRDGDWFCFTGDLEGRPFVLSLIEAPCEDDMSGDPFPMTARFERDGRILQGCAKPL